MNDKKIIICVGRQFGSGGKSIATVLGRLLDIPVYDNELLTRAAQESGFSKDLFEGRDERKSLLTLSNLFGGSGRFGLPENYLNDNEIFRLQSEVIRDIAQKGSAIFIGRCSDYILRDMDTLSVFITAPMEDRIRRVASRRGISESEASSLIPKEDRTRETYYNYYTFGNWGMAGNYDLCIDSQLLGTEGTADMIIETAKRKGLI